MRKRMVIAVAVAVSVLFALPSTYAQTTDLFGVVISGTPQSVQAAIDQGADVNARDAIGGTPLMWAAMYNQNPEVITTLLKAGADIMARDKGSEPPLMSAAGSNMNPEVITTLLRAGVDVNARDKNGMTALMCGRRRQYEPRGNRHASESRCGRKGERQLWTDSL